MCFFYLLFPLLMPLLHPYSSFISKIKSIGRRGLLPKSLFYRLCSYEHVQHYSHCDFNFTFSPHPRSVALEVKFNEIILLGSALDGGEVVWTFNSSILLQLSWSLALTFFSLIVMCFSRKTKSQGKIIQDFLCSSFTGFVTGRVGLGKFSEVSYHWNAVLWKSFRQAWTNTVY